LLAELEAPVLAFSFEDDILSPPRAVGNLLVKMRRARITHVTLAEESLDHFRWVRKPDALVEKIREWLPSDNV
jgi:predicted alpha/beta hydrolase